MTKILLCDTMNNYTKLLDEIFNVKFIKRAIQVKAMVDCQIMAIHPHMGKIIAYYDLLIYRYYSPVWNRNGEGKLQVLEEEEEEEEEAEEEEEEEEEEKEEEEDDDDDGDDDKKELDRGGLEKGEGVEIVVLKVVPKKKKNKKEKMKKKKKKKRKKRKQMKKMMGLEMKKNKKNIWKKSSYISVVMI